jgi:hypothetical protein
MKNASLAERRPVTNQVAIHLHMLPALMLFQVGGEIHRRDVVTMDKVLKYWTFFYWSILDFRNF